MRIAYISTLQTMPWGGSEELWYQSAEEAIRVGHKLGVFIYDWDNCPAQIIKLKEAGAIIYKRNRNVSLLNRFVNKILLKAFGKRSNFNNPYNPLLSFKPDIIVVTDGSTYYTVNDKNLSKLLLQSFKKKYIIISQSNSYYHLPFKRRYAIHLFENAARIFFVSEQNRRVAFHQLAFKLTKTDLIQNPVLLADFNSFELPSVSDTIHCGLVGRFSIADKGQDILIEMLSDDLWRNSNIVFHLYGHGADREYLENLITFYQLYNKVIIEGFKDNRAEIWKKCHCLLMCSHAEGSPLTVLEAMIAGRVCIVTNVGGNSEWINDGENGFLVSAPDKELFSAKLQVALERINEWNIIGERAHYTAMKKIDANPGKTLLNKIEEIVVCKS